MSFRIEKKIFIKKINLAEFKKALFTSGVKTLFQNRKVQSIYFDNINKQMYLDSIEGLTPRKKIRVRNYPDTSDVSYKLETKISSVEGRHKIAKKISDDYFKKIKSDGLFDPKYGVCMPLLNVIYEREYLKKDDIRITIDTDITYNIHNNEVTKKDENIIVELKTSKNKDIDDIFEKFPYQEIRFSKYCNGIELLNKI
tara:strand:+ start:14 stop:607 length:594 start_codon:yes stop_codon:yes gene_type:complete